MKLSAILTFLMVFSLAISGALLLYNDTGSNYGVTPNNQLQEKYSNINEYYGDINNTFSNIEGSESAGEGSNFLVSLGRMWSSVKLFFNNFEFVSEVSSQAENDLKLPPIITTVIVGLILVSLVTLLISIAIRWRVD